MNLIRLAVLVGLLGFGYHWWQGHKKAHAIKPAAHGTAGFVPVPMPNGAQKDTVLILAPVNCPSAAAKRADALADKLEKMGIPTARSNSYSLNVSNPSDADKEGMERVAGILNGEIPAVFVNGLGKSNPSAEEAAEAYRKTK